MKFNVKDLISKGVVKAKTYKEGPYAGLSVLKYSNSVFWDNLWGEDSRLLDCRGMVVDEDGNVIIWPFTKIFNRFENDTDLPLDQKVTCVRKVNGFMAAATIYKGELLVSTTGTLDSEFADLARKYISPEGIQRIYDVENYTFIFEICDPTDPHIVTEDAGAYLIGLRRMSDGKMMEESRMDSLADYFGWKRPSWEVVPFGDVVYNSKVVKHEGYVIRHSDSGELLLKIKSPHYLAKKFVMRGSQKKWEMMWDNPKIAKQRIDEEYYNLLDFIRSNWTKEDWSKLDSQHRRKLIEDYFSKEAQ